MIRRPKNLRNRHYDFLPGPKKILPSPKNFFLRGKNSYLRGRKPWFLAQKKGERHVLRAFSSSQYKYTTFSAEIQIALTFRNTRWNVKMQRFAAARVRQVLYYEARMDERQPKAQ